MNCTARTRRLLRGVRSAALARFVFRFRACGSDFVCGNACFVAPNRPVRIGDRVFIGPQAYIVADLTIGNDVNLGPRVMIIGGDHEFRMPGRTINDSGPGAFLPIVIEDDVWIGAGVIILKGVRIGRGAVVAAGALVNRDVEPYAIVGGNPARVIGRRFDDEQLARHKELLGIE